MRIIDITVEFRKGVLLSQLKHEMITELSILQNYENKQKRSLK